MTAPAVDRTGTCHLVGCPGKGEHPPHGVPGGIGAATAVDYAAPDGRPALVIVEQDAVVALLDWIATLPTSALFNHPAAATHALSRALAVARNSPRRAAP